MVYQQRLTSDHVGVKHLLAVNLIFFCLEAHYICIICHITVGRMQKKTLSNQASRESISYVNAPNSVIFIVFQMGKRIKTPKATDWIRPISFCICCLTWKAHTPFIKDFMCNWTRILLGDAKLVPKCLLLIRDVLWKEKKNTFQFFRRNVKDHLG